MKVNYEYQITMSSISILEQEPKHYKDAYGIIRPFDIKLVIPEGKWWKLVHTHITVHKIIWTWERECA